MPEWISINGVIGNSGARKVFLGFARGQHLKAVSFADVLDEIANTGYQRRFVKNHSLDFKKYIKTETGTTIPLTFNLRPADDAGWKIELDKKGQAVLSVDLSNGRVMAQVDCQHRMGFMTDVETVLPFMTFIGLSVEEEMQIFNVINSKAKGLNASLLDYHAAVMARDLAQDRPELFVALFLHREPTSPWFGQLDLGGKSTSGMTRKASLRTMQKAINKFLAQSGILKEVAPAQVCKIVESFWHSITTVMETEWENPRKHVLTKGIGVYALMSLAADLCNEGGLDPNVLTQDYFSARLSDFVSELDWGSEGSFNGLGGQKGVKEAIKIIRDARSKPALRIVKG